MKCLDIFYNEIVFEAASGRVDCYFMFNVLFETFLNGKKIVESNNNYENCIVPVLNIENESLFNNLLEEYINTATGFYKDDKLLCDIPDEKDKIKAILTLLWSNASFDDFLNPCEFLKKRISFFKDSLLFVEKQIFDVDGLDSFLEVSIEKDSVTNETPYSLVVKLKNEVDEYNLPVVRFGISNGRAYVYAIQNNGKNLDSKYVKKINRALYGVNEGFDAKVDNYDIYSDGNLKDITPSFVLVANVLLGLFNKFDVRDVEINSILITRWNAKEIATAEKIKQLLRKENPDLEKVNELKNGFSEHKKIQDNLTQKFIRTFRRLEFHHSGLEITGLPFDMDSSMHMIINSFDECNNPLLEETYQLNSKKFNIRF